MKSLKRPLAVLLIASGCMPAALAFFGTPLSIGVNFATPGTTDNSNLLASPDVAGVERSDVLGAQTNRQDNWRNLTAASGSLSNLGDSAGNPSGAGISWSGASLEARDWAGTTPDGNLLAGALTAGTGSVSLAFSDIPYASYHLVLYFDDTGDTGSTTVSLFQDSTMVGSAVTVNDNLDGGTGTFDYTSPTTNDFDEASLDNQGNYLVFTGLSGDSITIESSKYLNAAQVVENTIPEPAAYGALLGVMAAGIAWLRRRRA